MGPDSDHQSTNLIKTTLRPAHRGKGKNEGYLVLTFVEKKKRQVGGEREGKIGKLSK